MRPRHLLLLIPFLTACQPQAPAEDVQMVEDCNEYRYDPDSLQLTGATRNSMGLGEVRVHNRTGFDITHVEVCEHDRRLLDCKEYEEFIPNGMSDLIYLNGLLRDQPDQGPAVFRVYPIARYCRMVPDNGSGNEGEGV